MQQKIDTENRPQGPTPAEGRLRTGIMEDEWIQLLTKLRTSKIVTTLGHGEWGLVFDSFDR